MRIVGLGSVISGLAMIYLGAAQLHAAAPRDQVVAIINGKPISDKELEERTEPQLRDLNSRIYGIREQALNTLINEQLIAQEATRLKQPENQILEREVNSQVLAPTASEIESYYLGIKDRIGHPIEEVRPQISQYLTDVRRRNAYESYVSELRKRAKVTVLLAPPRAIVAIDPARVRGPPGAVVTVVEFSDFECPYCGTAEATLRELVSKYPLEVRLAYRDFPLDFHPRAEPAAEASRCALAQGKYWQYHDLLFANQQHLEDSDLSKFAAQLGMDQRQFDECVARKTYQPNVQRDVEDGEKLGATGTPAFFVNGIALSGAVSLSELSRVIDGELVRIKATR